MKIILGLSIRTMTRIILIFSLTLLLFSACKNDKSIQGFDPNEGFDENDIGAIKSAIVDTLDIAFSLSDTLTATGDAPLLSLGTFENVNTQILLKFSIPDSLIITDSRLILKTSSIFGSNLGQTFDATLHEVTASWDEDSVTAENFNDSFNSTELSRTLIRSTYRVDSLNIELVKFELGEAGTELIRQWADSTSGVENNGFLVNPAGSNFIKEFFSSEFSPIGRPQLELEIEDTEGVKDTLSMNPNADAYLVSMNTNSTEPEDGLLYIDNIFSQQSIIKFNLSGIPRESTINDANMILKVQQDQTRLNENGFTLNFVSLSKEIASPDSFELELPLVLLTAAPVIDENTTTITVPMRGLLQSWINETTENHGLLMRTGTPGLNISRIALCSGGSDSTATPRLEVDFTVPPSIP